MTTPEALRLAALLDATHFSENSHPAAAELRRLHADNERLRATLAASCDEEREQMWEAGPGGGCVRALEAERVNAELLDALRAIVRAAQVHACHHKLSVDGEKFYGIAQAAIKKAEWKG